jgi:DNA-binding PadR family transcriptional regulator
MLDLALLGLLTDQPLHGYEMKKQLSELVGARAAVSFGSLYPALGRLEKAGYVRTVDEVDRPALPMTGSLGAEVAALRARRPVAARSRRTRKVYAISSAGEQRLFELLSDPAADDRTFAVQVAFCRHLSPAARLELFGRRRAELGTRLAQHVATPGPSDSSAEGSERLRDRYRNAVSEREAHALRAELAWLDHLIDDERQLDEAPPTASPVTPPTPAGPAPVVPPAGTAAVLTQTPGGSSR